MTDPRPVYHSHNRPVRDRFTVPDPLSTDTFSAAVHVTAADCTIRRTKPMKPMKRIFLIVLDSVGAGELPDAADFGDVGANTLRSAFRTGLLHIPHLVAEGLGNVEGLDFLGKTDHPLGAYGKAAERSRGKDTTTGHWEIAGLISPKAMPTFPHGFPEELIEEYSRKVGRPILCNRPYSGTEVIRDYGRESIEKGALIVYTDRKSVV